MTLLTTMHFIVFSMAFIVTHLIRSRQNKTMNINQKHIQPVIDYLHLETYGYFMHVKFGS